MYLDIDKFEWNNLFMEKIHHKFNDNLQKKHTHNFFLLFFTVQCY